MSEPNLLSNNPDEDIAPVSPFGNIDYGVTQADLEALAQQFTDIKSITNRKEYDAAQAALTQLKRARSSVEARRKELKADSLEFGRLVDSTAKELAAVVQPEEERLAALVQMVKDQKAAEKAERERIEQERIDKILNRIGEFEKLPATLQRATSDDVLVEREKLEELVITEDVFAEFTERASMVKVAVIDELNELYSGALHDERIAREERLAREKQEAEQKAEAERLAKERAELEARQKEVDAENARKEEELLKQQAELKAEQERIDNERREKEAAAQREADAKEAAERAERLRPDQEKLADYLREIGDVQAPHLSSSEAEDALARIDQILSAALREAHTKLESL